MDKSANPRSRVVPNPRSPTVANPLPPPSEESSLPLRNERLEQFRSELDAAQESVNKTQKEFQEAKEELIKSLEDA
jgi:hypothetical protein